MINSYLLSEKINDKIIFETPIQMFLRVSIQISNNLEDIEENIYLLSNKYFIHASPTLFNSGLKYPQLSSCYLISMFDDSIDGIYDTDKACARISKYGGGIAVAVSNIRAEGSLIQSTNGKSRGLSPMLKKFNDTSLYVD